MAAKIQTQLGYAIPPAPRHSVTSYLPRWENIVRFCDRDPTLFASITNMYPRMMLHADVKLLISKFVKQAGVEGQICVPFNSLKTARECKGFLTSSKRGDKVLQESDISIRIFDIDVRYYVVFLPQDKWPVVQPFWAQSGLGTSSRMAEQSFNNIEKIREVSDTDEAPMVERVHAHKLIKERIANLLERAPVGPPRDKKVRPDDVYLFNSGMTSIYCIHRYLLDRFNQSSVLFGFAFTATIDLFKEFGPENKFLGAGSVNELEEYLISELQEGRKVQAVWAEFPTNPIIVTPDLGRLRELGDKYGFLLIIDDTIASFCNVDLLGVADIVVSSLTKTFSGYADVMGGSAVVNPSSNRYEELKTIFHESYRDEYSNGDAIVMEHNSRDYLTRSTKINDNARRLVEWLRAEMKDLGSSIAAVHYTETGPSSSFYKERMRPSTDEFTPGYGCLFSVELHTVRQAQTFYDNLNVYHGPHLGAHLTLGLPYVRGLYGNNLPWAAPFGLRETQIRVSVGLEDVEVLLKEFDIALTAANLIFEPETPSSDTSKF